MTIRTEIDQFCVALQRAVPLLTQWAPDGWVDFRDGTPATLRAGLMVKMERADVFTDGSFVHMPAKPGTVAEPLEFKAMLGGQLAASAATGQLAGAIPATAFSGYPKLIPPGDVAGNASMWTISFSIRPELLPELTAILDPPATRDWRR